MIYRYLWKGLLHYILQKLAALKDKELLARCEDAGASGGAAVLESSGLRELLINAKDMGGCQKIWSLFGSLV